MRLELGLGNLQRGKGLTGATGHDELTSVVLFEARNDRT